MKHLDKLLRRGAVTLLLLALSGPVLGAGAVLADDLADFLAPGDDPLTPGSDLYRGRSVNDGIPDMPSLVVMDVAPTVVAVLPPGPALAERSSRRPETFERTAEAETPSRAPPSRHSSAS